MTPNTDADCDPDSDPDIEDHRIVNTAGSTSMAHERIKIIEGDITVQKVGAVVNAANSSLLGGGGVDGAIHDAAGPGLLAECRTLQGCATGEAKITGGHRLPARWVIHTVGPIWRGGGHSEDESLAACYRNSLALARDHGARSIAFPAISTGAYRFPVGRACAIALREVRQFLEANPLPEEVRLVCFDRRTADIYRSALAEFAE